MTSLNGKQLILDEFVSTGKNDADSALLMKIKATIRNSTNIRVIVLTPSKEYANYLLTLNQLQGIVPLQGTYPIDQFPEGEWRSMHWSPPTMKVAARQLPELSSQNVKSINAEIDRYYDGLTAEAINSVTLLKVAEVLRLRLLTPEPTLDQLNVRTNVSSDVDEYEGSGCTQCCIC